jgi:hypothetical protein
VSGCPERLFEVDRVQEVAQAIATERKGRLLTSFPERKRKQWEKKRREFLESFIGLLFSFDPEEENMDDAAYQQLDRIIARVLDVLDSRRDDPFNAEAFGKITEAREWIASGYSPSRRPTEKEIQELDRRISAKFLSDLDS